MSKTSQQVSGKAPLADEQILITRRYHLGFEKTAGGIAEKGEYLTMPKGV